MNTPIRLILAASCALCLTWNNATAADLKIATIDMTRVLAKSPAAAEAETNLEKSTNEYQSELDAMAERMKSKGAAYREAAEATRNPALSEARQSELKDEAVKQLTALKEYELALRERKREIDRALDQQKRRIRERIITDLRGDVERFAKKQGYDLVVDTMMVVFQTDAVVDLTDQVIDTMIQDQ